MPGTLYIVATPIGNLEDITLRALRVLKDVDLIAAEDTRHTQILLDRHGIRASVTSYHEHNERAKAQELVRQLEQGVNIALVSDAGTPAISDPGYRLVVAAITAGVRVVPIPGASALTAVLSASGLPTDGFVFEGFLPAKQQQRRARLQTLCREIKTLIFYEAPHRLRECLGDIREILGDREMTLAREVSKVHEEFLRGPVSQILQQIADRPIKGEVTLVVRGWDQQTAVSLEEVKQEAHELLAQGMRVKEIAEVLGEKYGYAKKEIYRIAVEQKKSTSR
jgi:16S rRNA (cytidine1402-2'-O)-methyltransferase